MAGNVSSCSCSSFSHLSADRKVIDARSKQSKEIQKGLELIAKKIESADKLYRCEMCGQLWQESRTFHGGYKDYFFKVPAIETEEWKIESFVKPDELIAYLCLMNDYYESTDVEETQNPCKLNGCDKRAVRFSVCCLNHHVEELQSNNILPKKPLGRYFSPYDGT